MKNKILIIITLIVLVCLPLKALAAERNFPAGSLIIPMESNYQPDDDGGILEAYGLVFYLLNHTTGGQHDITVYWSINQIKTTIDGADFVIADTNMTEQSDPNVVVEVYNQGGNSTLTPKTGDSFNSVTYSGAPFIIDGADAAIAKSIIDQSNWAAIDVHEAQVAFAAPIHREMIGTPPKIALLNDSESTTGGNALILESYLRLAGICSDVYDTVTPNQVRDGILTTGGYDFLWAPHWTGYDKYSNDNNNSGKPDVEDIIIKIRGFLDSGKALFAECASIEVFEHSVNGRFLTDLSFGHNEGTNDEDDIIYNELHSPYSQIGDFTFDPAGGHLHNWRPFEYENNNADKYNLKHPYPHENGFPPSVVTAGSPSVYNSTVTRFVIDDTGWDYYVGGHLDGDTSKGYVVYLGGHSYASCGKSSLTGSKERMTTTTAHEIKFEFDKNISDEILTLMVEYDNGSKTWITADAADIQVRVSTFSIGSPTYVWKLSSEGTGEYYLERDDGNPLTIHDNPLIIEPMYVIENVTPITHMSIGTVGLLGQGDWAWGNNDSLGFDTIYVRISGDGDPDDEDADYLTAEFPVIGDPLEIDFTTASVDKKKLEGVIFRNKGTGNVSIDSMEVCWNGVVADQAPAQVLKKIDDEATDYELYDSTVTAGANHTYTLDFEFKKELSIGNGVFTLMVNYTSGSSSGSTSVPFTIAETFTAQSGDPLKIDLTTASKDKKNLKKVTFKNIGSERITVDSIKVSWPVGAGVEKLKKIKITSPKKEKKDIFKKEVASGVLLVPADPTKFKTFSLDAEGATMTSSCAKGVKKSYSTFSIESEGEDSESVSTTQVGCTDNSNCNVKNVAAARYVLNTLFNIKFSIKSNEYARAASIVKHPYLYQGSFEYPSYEGHFRRYSVTDTSVTKETADWDTADGHIDDANDGNSNGRKVYTSKYELVNGVWTWTRIDFDAATANANRSDLIALLDVTPANNDDSDEDKVIERVRGKSWDSENNSWDERSNKLGAIMHSAPVIVGSNSRSNSSRDETAYVGDLYGMLHAIETEVTGGGGETGDEKWAYIPNNMLNKLQNDRTAPNPTGPYAAVDGSPTAADIYYDHDNDGSTAKQWRTILVSPQGSGGNYIFALDITDPANLSVLWEITVEAILNYTGTGDFNVDDTVTRVISEDSPEPATGVIKEIVTKTLADGTKKTDLTLKDVVGVFKDGDTVFVDETTDPNGTFDGEEPSVTDVNVIEMGRAFRAALERVKWPVSGGYESKAVVFVATGFAHIAQSQGGINVFAFDLETGKRLWYFSSRYTSSVNDIPGAVTPFDTDGDGFVDQIFVGDMDGRMWQLDAVNGSNPNGVDETETSDAGKEIPLWNAGVGNPISVSPAIVKVNPVVVVFGTGGTDWAANDTNYYLYAINSTVKNYPLTYADGAGTSYWDDPVMLPEGEKVWSTPTIAAGQIYLSTSIGTMESTNPKDDVSGAGKVYALSLKDGSEIWSPITTGKARGSLYVDRGHVYLTTIDNKLVQIGSGTFPETSGNNVILKSWIQLD